MLHICTYIIIYMWHVLLHVSALLGLIPSAGRFRRQGTVPVAIDAAEGVFAVLTVALGGH